MVFFDPTLEDDFGAVLEEVGSFEPQEEHVQAHPRGEARMGGVVLDGEADLLSLEISLDGIVAHISVHAQGLALERVALGQELVEVLVVLKSGGVLEICIRVPAEQ